MLEDASFRQWLQQRKLAIVQLWEGDTFRVAIELFVLLFVGRHFRDFTRGSARSKREDSGSERTIYLPYCLTFRCNSATASAGSTEGAIVMTTLLLAGVLLRSA